jgi:hypothetical protein
MSRKNDIGKCDKCGKLFGYYLIHNGFNDSSYAYCDLCGATALLNLYKFPKIGIQLEPYQVITPVIEPFLKKCSCGGEFRSGATPKCPHCHCSLSATEATSFIEEQAEGTKKGWRWQRNWTGLYCIIIESKSVDDIWKPIEIKNQC